MSVMGILEYPVTCVSLRTEGIEGEATAVVEFRLPVAEAEAIRTGARYTMRLGPPVVDDPPQRG